MKERIFDYINDGRLHGVKPVTKEEMEEISKYKQQKVYDHNRRISIWRKPYDSPNDVSVLRAFIVSKEEYMKNCRDRTGEGVGDEVDTNETPEGTSRTYCRDCVHYQGIRRIGGWGECARRQKTVLGDHFSCPFFEHFIDKIYNSLNEDPNNEIPTNEKTEEGNKINLGDNIDETKLVLGDTPFLDKYIPVEWLEHLVESHKENGNQLLANQYRQVLTAWRISGAASYPLWKSSVQNTDTPT